MFKKIGEKICNYIAEQSMWKLIELEATMRKRAFVRFERKLCEYDKLFENPSDIFEYRGNFFKIIVEKVEK